MSSRSIRRIAAAGAAVFAMVLLASALTGRGHPDPAGRQVAPAPMAMGSELTREVPSMPLRDEDGRRTSLQAFRGRWLVLAPAITLCHEVCPMTTGVLEQLTGELAQAGLSGRVAVAEVTVDPWRDTPARLRAFSAHFGVNFELLTGTSAAIRRLWRFLGVYYQRVPQRKPPDVDWLTGKPETFDVQHTDGLVILDPQGQERVADEGMPDLTGRLPPALRALLNAQGRQNFAHPRLPWTAAQVLDDLYRLIGPSVAARAATAVRAPSIPQAERALADSPHH